jgi:hypothetical protein
MNKLVYILGDSHGKYDQLFSNLDDFNIQDCIIIHVGDADEYVYGMIQFAEYLCEQKK